MTENTTTTGTLEHVNPAALVLEENVRPDQALTKQFIASIKENGVLEPILARRGADGTLYVRAGARRTMAAREAELPTVPVYVTDADDDTAARVITQISENDHRLALRQVDRVMGIQTLLDTGLSMTKVAKKLAVSPERVKQSKAVAGSQVAINALAANEATLVEAAAMAEFADDEQALERLRNAVGRNWFDHEVSRLRQAREDRKAFAVAKLRYEAQGYEVLDQPPRSFDPEYVPLHALADNENVDVEADPALWAVLIDEETVWTDKESGERVDEDDIDWATEGKPDTEPREGLRHADAVTETSEFVPSEFYCRDTTRAGVTVTDRFTKLSGNGGRSLPGPKPKGDDLAEKRERRKVIALNKAGEAAQQVRREFVQKLLARKSPPKGAALFTARMLAADGYLLANVKADETISELLGIGPTVRGGIGDLIDKGGTTDARAQVIILGLVLGAMESRTPKTAWRTPGSGSFVGPRDYLGFLAEQGYTLSSVEQVMSGDKSVDACYEELTNA